MNPIKITFQNTAYDPPIAEIIEIEDGQIFFPEDTIQFSIKDLNKINCAVCESIKREIEKAYELSRL